MYPLWNSCGVAWKAAGEVFNSRKSCKTKKITLKSAKIYGLFHPFICSEAKAYAGTILAPRPDVWHLAQGGAVILCDLWQDRQTDEWTPRSVMGSSDKLKTIDNSLQYLNFIIKFSFAH